MKSLLLALAFLPLSFVAYAQLNTFSEGDVISAEQMNENFQYLEQQFRGARATTVNCDDGETINEAIEKGYTNITVSGTCNENLLFGVTNPSVGYSQKLAPRLLKLSGADSSATIKDTLENIQPLINIQGSTTLIIENLILDGGNDGVFAAGNSDLFLNDVTVQNFTGRGIYITDSTNFDSYTNITIEGRGQGTGLSLCGGSFGVFSKVAISDVYTGIQVSCNSGLWVSEFDISNVNTGIWVNYSKFNQFSENPGTISNVRGKGIDLNQSTGRFLGLRMLDFDNTGTGWNPAISVGTNSSLELENAEISGSTDGTLIQFSNHSGGGIWNSTITATSTVVGSGSVISVDTGSAIEISDGSIITSTSTGVGIDVGWNSLLRFRDSTLAGTATDGSLIGLANGSTGEIRNSTLTDLVSNEDGIRVSGGSRLNFRDSEISCTCTEGTMIAISGGSSTEIRDSSLELISGNRGVIVADSAELSFRNSTLSGLANYALVSVTRASHAIIQRGSELSHSNTSEVDDIEVSDLSFLNVWDSSVNSVNCYSKGYVSVNEGTVADLDPSCTE